MSHREQEFGTSKKGKGWILVGVDFSSPARQAWVHARTIARERDCGLMILHVIDAHGLEELARLAAIQEQELRERLGRERKSQLLELARELHDGGGEVRTEMLTVWGHPFEEILKKAVDLGAQMIVMGTAGRSADLERALFGSTAEKVLRGTPCPVLCVPTE